LVLSNDEEFQDLDEAVFLVGLALAVFTAAAVYKLYDSHDSMVHGAQGQAQCTRRIASSMLQHFHDLELSGER
jgi:methyl-accepting chemotaxis protein